MPAQAPEQMTGGAGAPPGLAWCWELDFDALLGALAAAGLGEPGDPHDLTGGTVPGAGAGAGAEEGSAGPGGSGGPGPGSGGSAGGGEDGGEPGGGVLVAAGVLAGRVAGHLAPGPGLAGWLCQVPAGELSDYDLAASAGSWRRLASWAQARELAAVAQIASRTAARDRDIGAGADGRPARVPDSAAAEVALELAMSRYAAAGWADLAVELGWRLAATGAALAGGIIDLARARLIAEAAAVLDDDAARAVEARVLPGAGGRTTGMLRAALRRAVIAADPQGAERRREQAERAARIVLYPDQDHTATLAGQHLPAIHAAAAMALISAQARAMKAAGAPGPLDLLRAQVFLGRLLGTLPPTPPAPGTPPGPSDDGPGDPYDPADPGPSENGPKYGDHPGGPNDSGPGGRPPGGPGRGGRPPRGGAGNDGYVRPSRGSRPDGGPDDARPGSGPSGRSGSGGPGSAMPGDRVPGAAARGGGVPPPGDGDAPRDEEDYPCPDSPPDGPGGPDGTDADDGWRYNGPAPRWPGLPALLPAGLTRPADGRPVPGLLDLSVPWATLAGLSPAPGHLGRIGPVTAAQARTLAGCAASDPAAEWRIIITGPAGHALAVTRIPRPRHRGRDGPPPGSRTSGADPAPRPGAGTGLVSRVTLTIAENLLTPGGPQTRPPPARSPDDPLALGGILARARKIAATAAQRARAAAAADTAAGGCAHAAAAPGYRPPPRLREQVIARDVTCRSPACRQPAWRGDLDHTRPFDEGGITCGCNLGGVCRMHHVIKHSPGWKLEQTVPGAFTWTTPAGRTLTVTPDVHPL